MAKTVPSNARSGLCSIMPGQGAKILHALGPKKKHETEAICNEFSKDFKNSPRQNQFLINKLLSSVLTSTH